MRIQTFSIIAGSPACNARCPFCVSKMTPPNGFDNLKEPEVNWQRFDVACKLAKQSGVTTAMFTGKGEPTLFPAQITRFLEVMANYDFPLIEIQTNGIFLNEKFYSYSDYLNIWRQLGMTTIAISIVHYGPEKNRSIYIPYKDQYVDLPCLIGKLHDKNFSVRLTCVGAKGFIDSPGELLNLLAFAKENQVEQLTFTPVNKPEENLNQEAWNWTMDHHLSPEQLIGIVEFLENNGHHVLTLAHGAKVYDLNGQNICLNNCLSVQPNNEELRNLIFFPDGHLRYLWQYEGAILL